MTLYGILIYITYQTDMNARFFKIRLINIDFRLKPLDIEFMKQLHNKVNIVPVIAKADVLTRKEVLKLKKEVSFLKYNRSVK